MIQPLASESLSEIDENIECQDWRDVNDWDDNETGLPPFQGRAESGHRQDGESPRDGSIAPSLPKVLKVLSLCVVAVDP